MDRSEVYKAIDEERESQDQKWPHPQFFMGMVAVIEAELNEVKLGWLKNLPGKSAACNELVQVAASAVAALEMYGTHGTPVATSDVRPTLYDVLKNKSQIENHPIAVRLNEFVEAVNALGK